MIPKIKICGLFREVDIEYANEVKPDYIGFIIDFPKSHRSISFDQAKRLHALLNKNMQAVGVFVNKPFDLIESYVKESIIDIVQLHGDEDEAYIRALRDKLPNVKIWKAIKVESQADIKKAQACSADQIILDNGYGTGECFNWSYIPAFDRKLILAGGLNPKNIKEAVESIRPWGIDISSGVETDKAKDLEKMKSIVKQIRS